jgi:uncharacterized protein (DUF2267 family)
MTRPTNGLHAQPGAPDVPASAERFFADIERSRVLPPNVTPADAASAVLCVLSLRVSGGQAGDLRQAMPGPLRDLFQRCPRHREEPPETFDRQEFLRRVADHLGIAPDQAEAVARAVFAALQEQVPSVRPQVDDIESQLPQDLKELWRPHVGR